MRSRLRLVLAASLGFASGACQQQVEELPDPKTPGFQYSCYPVQYLRPPQPPTLARCGHRLEYPDRERTYTIIMQISKEGAVQSARIPGEPSEAVSACLAATLGSWKLEPARTCSGEPLAAEYRVPYQAVFGVGCMRLPQVLPDAVSGLGELQASGDGRTNGCG